MKTLFFLLLATTIMTGCSQSQQQEASDDPSTSQIQEVSGTGASQNIQEAQYDINMDWLMNQLAKNFAEKKITLQELDSTELGYPDTKVLGFYSSGVSLKIFNKNHEIYGNTEEFEDAISRYQKGEFYGENMLYEKLLHPDVLMQFTKSGVMSMQGSSKKEYFFSLPNNEILKVKVSFPSDQEIDNSTEKDLIQNKVNEIEEILLRNLVFIRSPNLEFSYGPCDNTVNPFSQSDLGIKETIWLKKDVVQIKSFESLNCGEIIQSVGYTTVDNQVALQYLSPRCGGDSPCAKCMCAHELIYTINNMDEGSYQFRLERQY